MKKQIKSKLLKLSDEKYKKFHRGLCPGINNIIGIRIPVLRSYAIELSKQYSIEELIKKIDDEYYEEIMLQGLLIGLIKDDIYVVQKHIKEFVPKIDNWAICDTFCAGLKITKKYKKEMWEFLQKHYISEKEFEIRFGIVMILNYYIEEDYIEEVVHIFDAISNSSYYVQMAVAWAISICLIKFYDKTIKYLKNCKLDKFTYNKSLQKAIESYRISDLQKEELRKMKRKVC